MKYIRSDSSKRLFSFKRRSFGEEVLTPNETQTPEKPSWKCFSYQQLFDATNGFCSGNLVGKGGYAEVYKGTIADGEEIAVKRLTKRYRDEGKENEFLTGIGTVGHVRHSNVLPLLGCCIDNGLYLVFELSSTVSAASLFHDENMAPMEWKTRHKIAPGTARGLRYLHKGYQRRIIHRDIKASNILLTADFEPQLAPEYFMHRIVDEKTDVFAFGVFLLELISGRKPVDGSKQSLHNWAKPILNRGELENVVDPRLEGAYDVTGLK